MTEACHCVERLFSVILEPPSRFHCEPGCMRDASPQSAGRNDRFRFVRNDSGVYTKGGTSCTSRPSQPKKRAGRAVCPSCLCSERRARGRTYPLRGSHVKIILRNGNRTLLFGFTSSPSSPYVRGRHSILDSIRPAL